MELCVIACRWQATKDSKPVDGIAICKDPDTPITFINQDGTPYLGDGIWTYRLLHHYPWASFTADKQEE